MERYKKLFGNSLLFAIGNLGSKIISLIMVPLYTYQLTTSEYGIIDLVTVTISLLVPILTLELGQATIRYVIDSTDYDKNGIIFYNVFRYAIYITVVSLLMLPILNYFNVFENYLFSFIIILILTQFNSIISNYVRGIGLIKEFALNGILQTIALVASNILFLVVIDLGVTGYLISIIISNLISNIFLFMMSNGHKKIKDRNLKSNALLKSMLKFSTPLIPNSTMWWVINGATRYFILFFVGSAGNGLYAVASKIPSIISVVNTIFIQSWQISSFEEYDSEDKNEYNSFVYNLYYKLLFIIGSLILVIIIPAVKFVLSDAYLNSWKLIPFLVLGVIYQSLSGFLGVNFTASHKTIGAFLTSVYGGIASIISNLIFIPFFGLFGASLSAAISFFIMWLLRLNGTREYIQLNINWIDFCFTNALFLSQTIALFMCTGIWQILVPLVLFLILVMNNYKFVLKLIQNLIRK